MVDNPRTLFQGEVKFLTGGDARRGLRDESEGFDTNMLAAKVF